MLYLWNLFCCYGRRKDVGGKLDLQKQIIQENGTLIQSITCFFHRIQTLIECNCYQSNQWIYSHERGCVERDLFVVLNLSATFALTRECKNRIFAVIAKTAQLVHAAIIYNLFVMRTVPCLSHF